ncbi:MAG: sulfurtransferase TusA family protein [Candidatus Thorarchaeota archaeon]|jgi:TusA-related sulfurtransferase
MTESEPAETLDCIGLFCPQPIFEVKKGIDSIEVGQTLEMLTDDPGAEEDMKRWAKRTGHDLLSIERLEDGVLRFLVKRMK